MYVSYTRRLAACVALVILISFAQVAWAAEVLIGDAKSQPESLTMAPGGVLIVGSASSPFVYKVRPGSSTAEKFIDASAEGPGTFFFGMLADAATNTLWTCQLTPVPNTTPAQRHTALRSFDLTTGAPKFRWNLPGDNSTATILRSDRTRPSILLTLFLAESSGCRRELRRRNFTWNKRRFAASMASPSWMARSM